MAPPSTAKTCTTPLQRHTLWAAVHDSENSHVFALGSKPHTATPILAVYTAMGIMCRVDTSTRATALQTLWPSVRA